MKFKDWYEKKLFIGPFLSENEIIKQDIQSNYDVIINVSDEFILGCYDLAKSADIYYFWFPMNEVGKIELQSIYGALQVLYMSQKNGKSVYLHCHSGTNRSRIVEGMYWLMQNGTPPFHPALAESIEQNQLPSLDTINLFVMNCKAAFSRADGMRGGMLDRCKINCGL